MYGDADTLIVNAARSSAELVAGIEAVVDRNRRAPTGEA